MSLPYQLLQVEAVAAEEAAAAKARLDFRKKSAMDFVANRDQLEKANSVR